MSYNNFQGRGGNSNNQRGLGRGRNGYPPNGRDGNNGLTSQPNNGRGGPGRGGPGRGGPGRGGPDRGGSYRGGPGRGRGNGGGNAPHMPQPSSAPIFAPVPQDQPSLGRLPNVDSQAKQAGVVVLKQYDEPDQLEKFELADQYEQGLRVEPGSGGKNCFVHTNYLQITSRPGVIYVYSIEMVRFVEKKSPKEHQKQNDEPPKFSNRIDKMSVFQHIASTNQSVYGRLSSQKGYATDYDLIWSVAPLFQDDDPEFVPPVYEGPFDVNHIRTGKQFRVQKVRITFNRTLDLNHSVAGLFHDSTWMPVDQDESSILTRGINAFITQHARNVGESKGYSNVGANKFFINGDFKVLDGTVKATRGYFISVRPGSSSLLLNINTATSAFLQPVTVQQWLATWRQARLPLQDGLRCLKGKEVVILGTNTIRIIQAVGQDEQQKVKDWNALDLNNLLVNCGDNPRVNRDAVDYHLASELRILDNQSFRGRLLGDQTSEMIKFACQGAVANQALINSKGLPLFGVTDDDNQTSFKTFGLQTTTELMRIPARFLKAPTLIYGGGHPVVPREADWNLVKKTVASGDPLDGLTVLDLHRLYQWVGRDREPRLQKVESALHNALVDMGVLKKSANISFIHPQLNRNDTMAITTDRLEQLIKHHCIDASGPVLIIIPKKDQELYATIKRVSDMHLGFSSVCAASDKLDDFGIPDKFGLKGMQYFANVGLKLNLKGQGINHRVHQADLSGIIDRAAKAAIRSQQQQCDTIIIGADVAHPTMSSIPGCPSIAGVVGSIDDDYVQYPASMRLQQSRMEHIEDLDDMLKERLIEWAQNHNGRLPGSMLFYRDGVSESQYNQVRDEEIPQIQTAYNLAKAYLDSISNRPATTADVSFKLTFIVVGKRHNTRFFAIQDNDMCPPSKKPPFQKNGNVLPGLVVDHTITHPYSNDFYLQSHKPIQGTGRSAHYFVLTNQMQLSSNDLQIVTHSLCYIYARATKGVSYCAPAYYADRLCDRGQAYLRDYLIKSDKVDKLPRKKDESEQDFRERVRDTIHGSDYWRPHRAQSKYGQPRKNPWHENLDGIMFYL